MSRQSTRLESVPNVVAPPANLPPVPLDQMLVLVNKFLKTSVDSLDSFAASCQTRLENVSDELTDLEAMLTLVENKLPPLETPNNNGTSQAPLPAIVAKNSQADLDTSKPRQAIPAAKPATVQPPTASAAVKPLSPPLTQLPPQTISSSNAISQSNPPAHIAKYVSMLRVGVPREAVLAKMDLDKVNRSLLPL